MHLVYRRLQGAVATTHTLESRVRQAQPSDSVHPLTSPNLTLLNFEIGQSRVCQRRERGVL